MDQYSDIISEIAERKWKETDPRTIIENLKTAGKVTQEDISAIGSGRELDILVAYYVMGHDVVTDDMFGDVERLTDLDGSSVWVPLVSYSSDVEVSNQVIERLTQLECDIAPLMGNKTDGKDRLAEITCRKALQIVLNQG